MLSLSHFHIATTGMCYLMVVVSFHNCIYKQYISQVFSSFVTVLSLFAPNFDPVPELIFRKMDNESMLTVMFFLVPNKNTGDLSIYRRCMLWLVNVHTAQTFINIEIERERLFQ